METKKVMHLANIIDYSPDGIISREFVKNSNGGISIFSFDAGQRLSEHTAPFDAIVQILDGEAQITIDGEFFTVRAGEVIVMPAGHPHALTAEKRFKMLLTMIRG